MDTTQKGLPREKLIFLVSSIYLLLQQQRSPSPKILQTTMNPQQTNQNFTYITNFS